MGTVEKVTELVAPLVESQGVELYEVTFAGGLLTITLDRTDGIDLEAITHVSEQINDLLDLHDPVPGRYTLEVTSPGLERPLRTAAQFRRFIGSAVAVRTTPQAEGERRIEGLLTEADDDGIVVDGRRLAYDEIDRARTVFAWGPAPKPGKTKKKAPTP